MALVSPHGGLDKLVDRFVSLKDQKAFIAQAQTLPTVEVASADLATVYRIADGTLSPLTGPMNEEAYNRVLEEQVVVSNGGKYAWTIPTMLPLTDAEASTLSVGSEAALVGPDGEVIGTLSVESIYPWDKAKYIQGVYGTDRSFPQNARTS